MGKQFSSTWTYFTKVDEKLAQCNLCKKIVKTSGNTTNATNHLKIRHKMFPRAIPESSANYATKKNVAVEQEYQKQDEEDIQIVEEEVCEQLDEHSRDSYVEQQIEEKETSEEEVTYCMEMLDDEEEKVSEDSRVLRTKMPYRYSARSVQEDTKRVEKHRNAQAGSSDSLSAPRYDFSSAVDIFFASMAATVKQMPPEKIVAIKQKISTIVFQEELQQLRNESLHFSIHE
ncbi:uncharacterized protein LOC129798236 [Phlebotomus papatasi]|uniref:uncharacterized protein LOC129798236 n=1 Tax=Phlebotomus papatasi TaxID=29031 RepID=UPI002483F65A|nr:uncharacterized protein LOC129798236 [Phlebotomus papatasi]